jgi:hypothetical protein
MSDRFHGTMYMTLGCSRSPVTVAVPKSSLSAFVADFWAVAAAGLGCPAEAPVVTGRAGAGAFPTVAEAGAGGEAVAVADEAAAPAAGVEPLGFGDAADGLEVSALGSPASD